MSWNNIFNYASENKEWLFSGIGISIAILFCSILNKIFLKLRKRNQNNNTTNYKLIGGGNNIFNIKSDSYFIDKSFNAGLKYFNDSNHTEALKKFEIIYETNPDLKDLKYYYVKSLLFCNNIENSDKAFSILYENDKDLTNQELLLYAMLNSERGRCKFSEDILSKISTVDLSFSNFNDYIEIRGINSISLGVVEGFTTIKNLNCIADNKINSYNSLYLETIVNPYDDNIVLSVNADFLENICKVNGSMMIVYNKFFSSDYKKDYKCPIDFYLKSSNYFVVAFVERTIVIEYLEHIFNHGNYKGYFRGNDINLYIETLSNILNELKNAQNNFGDEYSRFKKLHEKFINLEKDNKLSLNVL